MSGVAIGVGGAISAVGSLAGGAMESSAAENAAETQAQASEKAATLQADLGQESLGYENYQYQQGRADDQPYLQSGANGLATLDYLMGIGGEGGTTGGTTGDAGSASGSQTLSIPGVSGGVTLPGVQSTTGTANTNLGAYGSLMQEYPGGPFTAPTAAQAAASPGEQFQLQQGEGAIQSSAAANGSLLTGGTMNALDQFGQNLASTNYNNVYNQALQNYNTNYNTWANQKTNEYNRIAGIAGVGQTTAQQLNMLGQNSANSVSNILGSTGKEISQDNQNAAAATASGYVGSGNAWGGALTGATGSLSNMLMMSQLMNGSGAKIPQATNEMYATM